MQVWARVYIRGCTIIFRFIFKGVLLYSDARKKARMSTSWRGNIFTKGLLYSGLYSGENIFRRGGAYLSRAQHKLSISGTKMVRRRWRSGSNRPSKKCFGVEDWGVKADLGWMILEISSPRRGFCTEGLLYSGLGPGLGWIWVG